MQINCLLPAPRAEEKRVVWKADQHSTGSQSCRTSDKCQHACISPPQPRQKRLRCVPTLWCTADICGGPCVDSALGVLGQGILPGPVKVVHLVLHEAADLLIFKATGVICGEGKGLVSCSFPNLLHRLPGYLQQVSWHCYVTTEVIKPVTDEQPLTSEGGMKISMISMTMKC